MNLRTLLVVVASVASIGASSAWAAPCAGFTDVDSNDPFCPNVEWLKNRAVTFGCTSTTLYCPTAPVSRLAMAAFMNRLGTALSPRVIQTMETLPTTVGGTYVYGCQTADIAVAHPQQAMLTGSVTFQPTGSSLTTRIRPAYSTDGGATWLSAAGGALWLGTASADEFGAITGHGGAIDLEPGVNYRFGLGVQIILGTGTYGALACRTTLTIQNRNGASSPYDTLSDGSTSILQE